MGRREDGPVITMSGSLRRARQCATRYYRQLTSALMVASCLGLPACGYGSPTAPAAVAAPPSISTAQSLPANLVISTFIVRAVTLSTLSTTNVKYVVQLQLTETSGQGGVTIENVTLTVPNGNRGIGCGSGAHVKPGTTWDMASMGYCAPDIPTSAYVPSISVLVTFNGDDGSYGELTGTAVVMLGS